MVEYKPMDMTEEARAIAVRYRAERKSEGGDRFGKITERIPLAGSFDPSKGRKEVKISPKGLKTILFGVHPIDLGGIEQIVDTSQTKAVGEAINYAVKYMDGSRQLADVVALVMRDIADKGLDVLSRRPVGDFAGFRALELAAAINRLRTLGVRHP
jgi:predicted ABC-class ATPase